MQVDAELRAARTRARLSQRDLARRTGVAQPTIARVERGQTDPRATTLIRLFEACGVQLQIGSAPGHGVDRTQMRELLRLSPRRRLELLRDDVIGLRRLEEVRR